MTITVGSLFVTHSRDTCIVVDTQKSRVRFVTMRKGYVDVEQCSVHKFAYDWPKQLEGYPALRAIRIYLDSQLRKEEQATTALRALRARLR